MAQVFIFKRNIYVTGVNLDLSYWLFLKDKISTKHIYTKTYNIGSTVQMESVTPNKIINSLKIF